MIVSRGSVASLVHRLSAWFAALVHTHVIADVTDASTLPITLVAGDVSGTGTAAGITTTIEAGVVTNAKLESMAQSTIKGRAALAGTGAPANLTPTQARDLLNVADGANAYVHPNHTGDINSTGDGATVIPNDTVTNAKLDNMPTATVKGRNTVGTGDPENLTTIPTGTVPAFTGDVTSAGGALALTIANDAVTNAKAANMADGTVKGRALGAGTGDPTDLTPAQVQAIVGTRALKNLLVNGEFRFAQRQAPGTLTTYSNTTGRTYGPDYWTITNENASAQFQRVDTATSPVTGLTARHYANFKKITSTGKVIVAQVIECEDVMAYRGRTVEFQMQAWNNVGSHVLRMVLLQLTSSGTLDTIPATFLSAFGAASTDPTWGTNLTAITPSTANANCSISGAGLSCTLTSSAQVFGGTFAVPSNCLNLIAVIFTNGQPVANDIFSVTEVGIYDGSEQRAWLPDLVQGEFARAQRRCCKTFNRDTLPVAANGVNTGEFRWTAHTAAATTNRSPRFQYPVPMRNAASAVTFYNPTTAANAQPRDQVAGGDCTAVAVANQSENGFNLTCTANASTAVGNPLGVHLLIEDNL